MLVRRLSIGSNTWTVDARLPWRTHESGRNNKNKNIEQSILNFFDFQKWSEIYDLGRNDTVLSDSRSVSVRRQTELCGVQTEEAESNE